MTLSLLHVKNIFLPSWNYVCAVDWTEQFYGVGQIADPVSNDIDAYHYLNDSCMNSICVIESISKHQSVLILKIIALADHVERIINFKLNYKNLLCGLISHTSVSDLDSIKAVFSWYLISLFLKMKKNRE